MVTRETVQDRPGAVENTVVDPSNDTGAAPAGEHFLAVLCGLGGALLGALAWSGAAALFDEWSLLAAPGIGWLAAWSCSYGARRPDAFSRSASWVLGALGVVSGLAAYSAFSVAQASSGSGLPAGLVGAELLRLLSSPPWFGSSAVLLALAGVPRALPGRPRVSTAAPAAGGTPVPTAPEDLDDVESWAA